MFWLPFSTATRMALFEHLRNRLAMWLVLLYLPIWLFLAYTASTDAPLPILVRATNEVVTVNSNIFILIVGAFIAVTQIVGFMMFMVTYRSGDFDRRLSMAGYPRGHLVAAKVVALLVISAVIAGYTTTIIIFHWQPQQPWVLAAAVFTVALTYGMLGVMLGALLRGELEGLFLIIMISIADSILQNPMFNPADSMVLRTLPTFGSMQSAVAAGFSSVTPLRYLVLELAWFVGLSCLGLIVFLLRTRGPRNGRADGAHQPASLVSP